MDLLFLPVLVFGAIFFVAWLIGTLARDRTLSDDDYDPLNGHWQMLPIWNGFRFTYVPLWVPHPKFPSTPPPSEQDQV